MKYEKFEEWMLGKKVTHVCAKSSGVIVERPAEDDPDITVRVKYDEGCLAGDTVGAWLRNLEFLEEKPSEEVGAQENSQIDWQVGQEVFCLLRGKGFVVCVGGEDEGTPYTVEVDFGYTFDHYTIDGKMFDDHKGRVLFFSEPVITAELFPPKKPFKPTLKKGDIIAYRQRGTSFTQLGTVEYEDEDSIAIEEDAVAAMRKHAFEFYKLGEEIKFES